MQPLSLLICASVASLGIEITVPILSPVDNSNNSNRPNNNSPNNNSPNNNSPNNNVWAPLPQGFDQKKPNDILPLIKNQGAAQKDNQLKFDGIYVFGDSACDTQNYFSFMNRQDPDPKVYWNGRFSNGPMWPDYLEAYFNLPLKNFAYGGAVVTTSNFVNVEGIPDFAEQIVLYKNNTFPKGKRSLAILQFVGNDLLGKGVSPAKVAKDMELMLQWLVDIGELRDFLVLLSPIEDYITWGYNNELINMVKRFGDKTKEDLVQIEVLDIIKYYTQMAMTPPPTAEPKKWHPVYESCYNQTNNHQCQDPWNYFRFDLYHPSTVPNHNTAMIMGRHIQKSWPLQ